MDQLVFTSASILDLLSSIDELKDKNINLTETESGISITIGESTYEINTADAVEVEVDEEVVQEIDEVTAEAYSELSDNGVDMQDEVEGGPIKEIIKTLMLGGMVKMTANMLKK